MSDAAESPPPAGAGPVRCVLGDGPDALLVAVELAKAGCSVVLFTTVGRERLVELAAVGWSPLRWLGRELEVPPESPSRGLAIGGQVISLPVPTPALPGLVSAVPGPARLRSLARARVRNALAEVVGGGQEERSYEDWAVRRFGRPLHDGVFAPYAEARWGRPAGELAASLARVVHGTADHRAVHEPEPDCGKRWSDQLHRAAVQVVELQTPLRLEVEDGTVRAIESADGTRHALAGPLWTTCAPDRIAAWLGEACPVEARAQAPHLPMADVVVTRVSGLDSVGPAELHVVARGGATWLAVAGSVVPGRQLRTTVPVGTSLERVDLDVAGHRALSTLRSAAGCEGGAVESVVALPSWQPAWTPTSHPRLRRVLLAWDELGIVPVGRGGLYVDADPPLIQAHVQSLLDGPGGSAWDRLRRFAAPPVRAKDLDVSLTRIIER